MRHILLPTDFSENAKNAIRYALNFYNKQACHFTFLHVYKVNDYEEASLLTPIPRESLLKEVQKEKKKRLLELIKEVENEQENKLHKYDFVTANKSLVSAVKEEISKKKITLVVIGTQGHTGAIEVIYGSNTVNLMEEIQKCPVLAVPAQISFHGISEIVLANSFKAELNPEDLHFLIELSFEFRSPIRILHIEEEGGLNEMQKRNKKNLKERLSMENVDYTFHSLEYLSIPLGIYSFVESRGSEIIAFINKKHGFFENLLFDPLYKNLAHYSKVPVLILHQPKSG